jgi:hypothetical protein
MHVKSKINRLVSEHTLQFDFLEATVNTMVSLEERHNNC